MLRSLPYAALPGCITKTEPGDGSEAPMNGPTKAPRAMPLQEISRQANLQATPGLNHVAKRKREGEETSSGVHAQGVSN